MTRPLRIAVTGRQGQVVSALRERARAPGATAATIIPLGRPELDLVDPDSVARALAPGLFDVIVNAAAYTAVDQAETDEAAAFAVNAAGAEAVARAAARAGAPLIHLSTDYVFAGDATRPYREDDAVGPTGVYGRSKCDGERRVALQTRNCAIIRTAWVYSPFGANFVRTMLRLGRTRAEVGVVADQIGNPTAALDLADAILAMAHRLANDSSAALRGVFHLAGAGAASWADVAEVIFAAAAAAGRAPVRVRRLATADYPTAARRPANSRLDGAKLAATYGVSLPFWRTSLTPCVTRLLAEDACAIPRHPGKD